MNLPLERYGAAGCNWKNLPLSFQLLYTVRKLYILFLSLGISICALAQKRDIERSRSGETGKSITQLDLKKDFNTQVKILKKEKQLVLLKGAVHFKVIDQGVALVGKGQRRTSDVSYAILEGVSDDTRKEIVEEFNAMLIQKLEGAGFSFTNPDNLESSNKYAMLVEKQMEKTRSSKGVGAYQIETVEDKPLFKPPGGNVTVWNGMIKLSKEVEAPLISYDVIIDFARFDIEASRWKTDGYGPGYEFQHSRSEVNILPQIGVQNFNGFQMNGIQSGFYVMDGKGRYDFVHLSKNVYVRENYALDIDAYKGKIPESMKRLVTIATDISGTFVVKADEEKYKRIALEALDAYSDYLVEALQQKLQ